MHVLAIVRFTELKIGREDSLLQEKGLRRAAAVAEIYSTLLLVRP